MALSLKKMGGLEDVNVFMRGGHVGGKDLRRGVFGLHGKTLIFTTPAGTVTFATPNASLQEALTATQIVAQINAVHAGMAKTDQKGRLVLEKDPPVGIAATALSTALPLLGFGDSALAGTVYNPPGTPPSVESITPAHTTDGVFYLLLDE